MTRITCPKCGRAGSIPDNINVDKIRCPACGERFRSSTALSIEQEVNELLYPPAPLAPPNPVARVNHASIPAVPDTKACPFCGEEILVVAKKCKHCNEMLDPVLRAEDEARRASTARSTFVPKSLPQPQIVQPQAIQQTVIVKAGRPKTNSCVGCAAIILVTMFAFSIIGALTGPRPRPAQVQQARPPAPAAPAIPLRAGDVCVIELPGGKIGPWIALGDDAIYQAMLDAQNRNDIDTLATMMARSQVVQVRNGTRAKVFETNLLSIRVRLLDGEHAGFEGTIQREFAKPAG